MVLTSLIKGRGLSSFNVSGDSIMSNIIAHGGLSLHMGDNVEALFHDCISTLQVKNFFINRMSIFESPLSAELDFCPGPAHQSFFSRTPKPMFQLNIRCGPKRAKTDMTFYVEKLTHIRKTVEDAFAVEFQNTLKGNDRLSYSWMSRS